MEFGVNWAIGASALALIEVIVNKKLEELGLKKDGGFDEKVKRLSLKAKEKGIALPDLLTGSFRDARNKVIHAGKKPTSEELKIIIEYLALYSGILKLN